MAITLYQCPYCGSSTFTTWPSAEWCDCTGEWGGVSMIRVKYIGEIRFIPCDGFRVTVTQTWP